MTYIGHEMQPERVFRVWAFFSTLDQGKTKKRYHGLLWTCWVEIPKTHHLPLWEGYSPVIILFFGTHKWNILLPKKEVKIDNFKPQRFLPIFTFCLTQKTKPKLCNFRNFLLLTSSKTKDVFGLIWTELACETYVRICVVSLWIQGRLLQRLV